LRDLREFFNVRLKERVEQRPARVTTILPSQSQTRLLQNQFSVLFIHPENDVNRFKAGVLLLRAGFIN
jgi:hypothetical protein